MTEPRIVLSPPDGPIIPVPCTTKDFLRGLYGGRGLGQKNVLELGAEEHD